MSKSFSKNEPRVREFLNHQAWYNYPKPQDFEEALTTLLDEVEREAMVRCANTPLTIEPTHELERSMAAHLRDEIRNLLNQRPEEKPAKFKAGDWVNWDVGRGHEPHLRQVIRPDFDTTQKRWRYFLTGEEEYPVYEEVLSKSDYIPPRGEKPADSMMDELRYATMQPTPEWKPGQMLIHSTNPDGHYVVKLDVHTGHGFWTFKRFRYGSWELVNDCRETFRDYEPYPRVGDWVRYKGEVLKVCSVSPLTGISALDGWKGVAQIADLEPAESPEHSRRASPPVEQPKCGAHVCHLIAGASWFPCALSKGHDGEHRAGGSCSTHGGYLGEPNSPPQCPKCDYSQVVIEQPKPTLGGPHWHESAKGETLTKIEIGCCLRDLRAAVRDLRELSQYRGTFHDDIIEILGSLRERIASLEGKRG